MGKRPKSSRKRKKEWRADISTEDIQEYYDKSPKDALSGGSLADAPSDSLFYVDKSIDLSAKRKIEKRREKVLHCDSVLQSNTFVQAIPSSREKKSHKEGKEIQLVKDGVQDGKKPGGTNSRMVDMWGDGGELKMKPRKMKHKPSAIPAVEVAPPGCSFNPTAESHQDSLSLAVAGEMQKIYRKELAPQPVPLTVPGEVNDEENMYFLDADDGSDEDSEQNEDPMETGDVDSEKRCLAHHKLEEERKKELAAFSCPPLPRTKNKSKRVNKAGEIDLPKSWTDPHQKQRKKRTCTRQGADSEFSLPADFVKQQNAYFKEVDEFELQVEEASHNELDT